MEIKHYDLPVAEYLTPAAAKEEIAKLDAASFEEGHPLHSTAFHPQRKDFVKRKQELYEAAFPPDPEGRTELQVLMDDAMEEKADRDTKKASRAYNLQADLVEHGYPIEDIPDGTPDYFVKGLEMRKMLVDEKHDVLGFELREGLRKLKQTDDTKRLMEAFTSAESKLTRTESADTLIRHITQENKKKHDAIVVPEPEQILELTGE